MTDRDEIMVRLERAEKRLAVAEAQIAQASRRARLTGSLGVLMLMGLVLMLSRPAATAQGTGDTLASLLVRVIALETKTEALTQTGAPGKSGALLRITGDNVQIVSGSGRTDDWTGDETKHAHLTGLGNLIIGYNESRKDQLPDGDIRTGSHNLILGNWNNYSSVAGIVAGAANSISGSHPAVLGGYQNSAGGEFSTVSGGRGNSAEFACDSISGGVENTVRSFYTSVSGGEGNIAEGFASSISGGTNMSQSHEDGWAGGHYHSPIQKSVRHRSQSRPNRKAHKGL